MKIVLLLGLICFSPVFAQSDLRFSTGAIDAIDRSGIQLDYDFGGSISIGFLCESKICDLTENFNKGDVVLLTLGSIDGKNELKNISLCYENELKCATVNQEQKQRKMLESLAVDPDYNRDAFYITNSILSLYVKWHNINPEDKNIEQCVYEHQAAHYQAYIRACEKHQCGARVGGGCDHLAGYGSGSNYMHALRQCK